MNKLINLIEAAWYRARGYYPGVVNGMKLKLDPYHIPFWRKMGRDQWEPQTFTVLSTFLNADSVYCDIGAWIGPTVIYAAKICKRVICFEPDPVAYEFLRWNIDLNALHNVTSFSIALSSRMSIQRMSSFGGHLGDSMSSLIVDRHKSQTVDVLALTWDTFIDLAKIEKMDFIKIDIEGGEFTLLPTLKNYLARHKPVVYLSLHAPLLDAGIREEKMQQVIDVMSIYNTCLDHNLAPVDIHTLLDEQTLMYCTSYMFLD
ncbi:MAG: FkbM family methyltransferase [Anaerolineae bacterium]|nr:FkbM family methyltransferase [Anaerolineae bacterium]